MRWTRDKTSKFESCSSTKKYSILLMVFVLPAVDVTSIRLIYLFIAQYEQVAFLDVLYFKTLAFFGEISAAATRQQLYFLLMSHCRKINDRHTCVFRFSYLGSRSQYKDTRERRGKCLWKPHTLGPGCCLLLDNFH